MGGCGAEFPENLPGSPTPPHNPAQKTYSGVSLDRRRTMDAATSKCTKKGQPVMGCP
ncbi:uncharacterized protein RMCFA_4833 [Mycolicibacterium fortuitum subsp. acetamidolyticum]|uniref:Uncharacterized protein n=1 Tax=Mycolicibacterium fortuitum subsp. acetamidolyticum TaxID=144550 RepID=A0A100WUK3_MYCFO|nr:uncharacterized protein RMCFA_4833 [Mycolicibacterium fortuitum subsp. acetamidolyticum]